MTDDKAICSLFDALSRGLFRVCSKLGHWLTNVEEGHARCRICRAHLFCSHATHDQIARHLLGNNYSSNLGQTITYTNHRSES